MRKVWSIGLRLLGPVLLVVVLLRLDAKAVLSAFASAELSWVLAASAMNAITIYLKVVRWQVLLRSRDIRYGFWPALGSFMSSLYIGMLTPGRVGDALRAQYLHHDLGVRYAEGLASVAMDRIYDLVVVAGFVVVALVRFGTVLPGELAYFAWVAAGLSVLAPLALLAPGVAERVLALVWKLVPAKLLTAGAAGQPDARALFLESVRVQARRSSAVTLPLTIAAFATNYVQGWMLARALGMHISIPDVTSLMATASLLGLLPVSVSGVGLRELFFAVMFPALGLRPDQGVTYGLLIFAVMYLLIVAFGFIAWQVAPPPTGKRGQGNPAPSPE